MQIIVQCGVQSRFVCNAQKCSACRNATTAAYVCDHKVEMESDAERRQEINQGTSAVTPLSRA